MKEKIKIVSKLLPYPYVIYQKNIVVTTSNLNNHHNLKYISNNVPNETSIIFSREYEKFTILSLNYKYFNIEHTISVFLDSDIVSEWRESEWDDFHNILHNCSLILSSNEPYTVKFLKAPNTIPNIYHTKAKDSNKNKLTTDFQDNYQLESDFISLFHKKSIVPIKALMQKIIKHTHSQSSILSSNILNDKKYRLVTLVALLTREILKYGCSAQSAYRLSDQLIFEIDKIDSVDLIAIHLDHIISEFFNLYHSGKQIYKNPIINSVINYVDANLYQTIKNTDIADYLSIHPAYLSNLFKKVTGMSLSKFIVEQKVSEAKYLLINTNFMYSEIASLLHFSNQSHFCKLFKNITGMTPKEFRNS